MREYHAWHGVPHGDFFVDYNPPGGLWSDHRHVIVLPALGN